MRCPICDGSGKIVPYAMTISTPCDRCGGTGQVPDKETQANDRLAAIEQRLTVIEERLAALDTSQLAKDVERVVRKLTEPPPKVRR